jgi:hypothetical protein
MFASMSPSLGLPSTVRLTLQRLAVAWLGWPLPAEMTDAALEVQLFTKQGHRRRVEPDWAAVHRELKRKHVTLQILWDEYIERHPHGYRYSRFFELYRGWASRISVTMPRARGPALHAPGARDCWAIGHAGGRDFTAMMQSPRPRVQSNGGATLSSAAVIPRARTNF